VTLADRIFLLNTLMNDPAVLAEMAPGYAAVDMTPFFQNPANVMLGDENGVVLFVLAEPGIYEGHFVFPRRRRDILAVCREHLRTMFTVHGAQAIHGFTPIGNRAARALSHALGFANLGHSSDSSGRSCVKYVLERTKWERSSGHSLE
jgi:hypothetical protein